MQPHSSASRETYTRYSDGEGQDRPSSSGSASAANVVEAKRNQQLLQEVLGETLIRTQEDSVHLAESLRKFRHQHSDQIWDEALFVMIAGEVLRHRLGERSKELPGDLFAEVGLALWSHPVSRARIERLWNQLGSQS